MTEKTGTVVSVHIGAEDTLEAAPATQIELALDGIVGDRHRGLARECWKGDKQAEGSRRRNERQWSAVSLEELAATTEAMQLSEPLQAATLGANLCIEGLPYLSRLPRGTLLTFSSGVVLMVEEYNPPCSKMGRKIAALHHTVSGAPLADTAFSQAAKFSRGIVGVVEVAGCISAGDKVSVTAEQLPKWLRTPDWGL